MDPSDQFRGQLGNPRDILSLLLLVGGDIVQKAIAQLIGHSIRLPTGRNGFNISIAPVAFSFGWVAYGFTNLMSAVGDMSLMPRNEQPSLLVNCSNGFTRENRSWILGRILRDHELKYRPNDEQDQRHRVSVRIDIFRFENTSGPRADFVWWSGWVVFLMQLAIAAIPWALFGDWSTMVITMCGTILVFATCAMPQWTQEKFAGRNLSGDKEKVMCLTRGNGSPHIIVLIGGGPDCWDLESFAAAGNTSQPRPETRAMSLILALLWTVLLTCVAGLEENTWYLVAIGGIGMLQNVLAAGAPRHPSASNLHLKAFERAPTIIGRSLRYTDDVDAKVDLKNTEGALSNLASWASAPQSSEKAPRNSHFAGPEMPQWLTTMSKEDGVPDWLEATKPGPPVDDVDFTPPQMTRHMSTWRSTKDAHKGGQPTIEDGKDIVYTIGVHGALMELEKWVPTAGLAMVQMFFPGGLSYNDASVRDNVHKKFWQQAYHTAGVRKKAEARRRAEERKEEAMRGGGEKQVC